jgi:serine/threonine-protein kinase
VVVTAAPAPSSGTLVIPRDSLETAALPGSGAHGVAGDAPARRRAGPRRTAPRRAARRAGARALAVAAVVAVVLAGGLALSWNRFLAPPVPVPSLANASRDQAEAALEGMGLQARVAGTATSRTVPREGVVAQDPPPGTELRRGGTVALTLSKGPAIVAMPSVLGLTREEALARLRAEPLALEVQVDESYAAADAPAGRVQAQVPAPDAAIPEGSAAVVNVSLGPEQLPVPDLLGRTRQEAEALLAEARLEGRFSEGYRDDEPRPGRVAEQSVAPGEQVDRGTPIAVVLSRGPASVQVPDLYLRPLDEARQELAELGLEVEVEERPRPRIGPIPLAAVGLVEAQDPPAGTSLQRGGTVRLFTYADRGQG